MPLGSRHREEGVLLRDGNSVILQLDDGGRWRLEPSAEVEQDLGRRVQVEGVRSGFDVLTIEKLCRP